MNVGGTQGESVAHGFLSASGSDTRPKKFGVHAGMDVFYDTCLEVHLYSLGATYFSPHAPTKTCNVL